MSKQKIRGFVIDVPSQFGYNGKTAKKVCQKNNMFLYWIQVEPLKILYLVRHPDGTAIEFNTMMDAKLYMSSNTQFMDQNSSIKRNLQSKMVTLTYDELQYLIDLIPERERWRFLIRKLIKAKGVVDAKHTNDNMD
jgi:hypothetical protein